jgi:hypothetical protein
MTPLRQRMLEDMQLRGLAVRTQESYLGAVRRLAGALRAIAAPTQRRGGARLFSLSAK